MKSLKLLNDKNFTILIIFLSFFIKNVFANEPVDIWTTKDPNENQIKNIEKVESEDDSSSTIFINNVKKKTDQQISEELNLVSKNTKIVGIYDPSKNDLSIDMWTNSNGKKIVEIINKIQSMNLSKDSTDILNIALLTNSYQPKRNMTGKEFLKIKSDWLMKQQNLNLIETYLQKNTNLIDESELIKYYLDYYLSRANLSKSCEIFNKVNNLSSDNYVSKFSIYCLINLEKKDEAQLQLDLLKENGFNDIFFEKKFAHLMNYKLDDTNEISEKSLLNFHLSHRTNPDFIFEPKITTDKKIWKYLSSSNLLQSAELIDIEDKDKIFSIEKATHEKNYNEEELFAIYERFMFNINQLLTVKETYKLLPKSQSRALLYQGILLTKETPEKIKLIKLLKDSFEQDNISSAFEVKLANFLKVLDAKEIPSNYTDFYLSNLKKDNTDSKKIKINNKIIHQSKLINYFKDESSNKNIEKDLENILNKIKKDKKYLFSTKDIILLESLKADGINIPKKYKKMYEVSDPNIPYDIQILINREEEGLALLRLVEVIGEDDIIDLDPETLYFIVSILNQLDIDRLRNKILIKILPLKA
tara:strand:+ start:2519 stop:4279 length:1761 start_codon:yes stop_codon:yes gene_type:complete